MNIKSCMCHISGTWELLLCEYWRKGMIIGGKKYGLEKTKTSLFDRNWATSLKPRRRSRPLRLVLYSSCVLFRSFPVLVNSQWFGDSCIHMRLLTTLKSKQNQNKYLYYFLVFLQVEYCIRFWSARSTPKINLL